MNQIKFHPTNPMEQPHTLKPYLMQGVYNWCIDAGMTPYIEVVNFEKNKIPAILFQKKQSMLFDISGSGVSKFSFAKEGVKFQTKINQKVENIFVSYHGIKKIYAKELGHGLEFSTYHLSEQETVNDPVNNATAKYTSSDISSNISADTSNLSDSSSPSNVLSTGSQNPSTLTSSASTASSSKHAATLHTKAQSKIEKNSDSHRHEDEKGEKGVEKTDRPTLSKPKDAVKKIKNKLFLVFKKSEGVDKTSKSNK